MATPTRASQALGRRSPPSRRLTHTTSIFFRLVCSTVSHARFSAAYTYLVWTYGREGTYCSSIPPANHTISVSSGSTATYAVYRSTVDRDPIYAAYINGFEYHEEPAANLDTCWGGSPKFAKFHDEVAQVNDQSGGTTASNQLWTAAKYPNTSYVWHGPGWSGGICSNHDLNTMGAS
jgi:hypothetical protein